QHTLESIVGNDPLAPFAAAGTTNGRDGTHDVERQPALALGPAPYNPRAAGNVPFVLGGDETAYVRAESQGSSASSARKRQTLAVALAAVVVVLVISLPLLFIGGEEPAVGQAADGAAATAASSDPDNLLRL